ncbi:MAG: ethanolamine ammonia-lyase reactivating factor EutA [Hyphomonadaceae bacterium]|nr:ethanolamine ammonia-lyase reactivating factor EutA [Hyphomonadaceae bacterium]
MSEEEGGRIFFSTRGRRLVMDDEITLTSVGVDIGSSTSHLVFSQITLERLDSRYVVSERKVLYESDILLTPYLDDETIDDGTLRRFVDAQYERAQLSPASIDTGALVLTGVAVRRANARSIADVFAREAGKLVAVSAGDSLETIMSAYGSGAVARSIRERRTIVNVDIGGGTSKIAVCADGEVIDRTAVDIGARIVAFDDARRITRLEEAGKYFLRELGLDPKVGDVLSEATAESMAHEMAVRLLGAVRGQAPAGDPLLRLDPLGKHEIAAVTMSGGVSEYVYADAATARFGDLGPLLARAFSIELQAHGFEIQQPDQGIRATVIGAAQYTAQVSGGTIFVSPLDMLPLRNAPVIAPSLPLDEEEIDRGAVAEAIKEALRYMELDQTKEPVAVFVRWRGSASFARLDAFTRGLLDALSPAPDDPRPIILVGDADVGGLIGIHIKQELKHQGPIASLDGLDLKPLDYIDIGEMLESSGAAPVVIKSLVFPADSRLGKPT